MPIPKSPPILVSPSQRSILESISRQSTVDFRFVIRSKMVLLMDSDLPNTTIAVQLSSTFPTVQKWRYKWLSYQPLFKLIEESDKEEKTKLKELDLKIKEFLGDRKRSGCLPKFTPEQYCRILAVALEPPKQSERPIDRWTERELADECIKRNIVKSISPRQIGRFLKRSRS